MKKFILIAVCLLLVALLTLGVCMYAIGENKDISKPYDMGSEITVTPPEDTPTAQDQMEQKFSVYNHVTEENGKKILTLFSEEQAEEQWTKRENGEDFRLTYDEILFLIDQSRRLYETYDEIVLTNSNTYGITESAESSEGDCRLISNKGDFSGMSYREEREGRLALNHAVVRIATYRVAMLDSRMRKVTSIYYGYSGIYGLWNQLCFEDEKMTGIGLVEGEKLSWVMIPDDVKWESEVAYRAALKEQLEHSNRMFSTVCSHPQVPYVCIEFNWGMLRGLLAESDGVKSIVAYRWEETSATEDGYPVEHPDNLGSVLYPILEVKPVWELKGSYLYIGRYDTVALNLFRGEGVNRTASLLELSHADELLLSSLLGDGDALVERYRSASESYTAEEVGAYYLEMRLGNGTSLLVPLMKPIGEDYALGCVVETADTYTGLSFRPCLPANFASWASYWAFSQGGRFLPKLKPADLKGDHFAAWQTENTPFFVLGENGKGYLRGNGEEDRILSVLYTREEDGTVVLLYENEAGETLLRHVYRPQNFGFVYDAEASFGYGVYQFSDGTAFYYNG